MFDFTARNFTGALCDPDNLPVTKFSAKNSLYEIIDKEIITSEMIQELIKQTQNTETRIILHDDNQKVKTLSQPLTSLFSLLEPDQIQSDGQNRCLFYPFCNEKFRNFTESVIHTYFHCNNHPKEINKFKIFLPHELLIYMNLYEKFEMFIPNLVNTILPFDKNLNNFRYVTRMCPFPECNVEIYNPEIFLKHCQQHVSFTNVMGKSFQNIGLLWMITISHIKCYKRIPSITDILKINIPINNIQNLDINIEIDIQINFINYYNVEFPPWIAVCHNENVDNLLGIPTKFKDGGVLINKNIFNNFESLHQTTNYEINMDERVQDVTDDINAIVTNTTIPYVEEPTTDITLRNSNAPNQEKVKEIKMKLVSILQSIIETRNVKLKITVPKIQIHEEIHEVNIPKFNLIRQENNINIPNFELNCLKVPINIPIPQMEIREHKIDVPKVRIKETGYNLILPNINILENYKEVKIPKVNLVEDLKEINIPKVNFIEKPKDVHIPNITVQNYDKKVNIPNIKTQKYDELVKLPNFLAQYIDVPVRIPRTNIEFYPLDIKIPLPNYILESPSLNTTSSNNTNSEDLNSSQSSQDNITNTSSSENISNNDQGDDNPNNIPVISLDQHSQDRHTPRELIEDLKTVHSEIDLRNIIIKWKNYNITNTQDWIDPNIQVEDTPILNLIVIKNKWPGVNPFSCPYACGSAFTSITSLNRHQKECHSKILTGNIIHETISNIIEKPSYWEVSWRSNDNTNTTQIRKAFWACSAPGCEYFGDNKSIYGSHISKCHKIINNEKNIYGWFWATILEWIRQTNESPTTKEIFRGRNGCKCKNCNAIGSNDYNIRHHSYSMHGTSRMEGHRTTSIPTKIVSTIDRNLNQEQIAYFESESTKSDELNKTIKNRNKNNESIPINERTEETTENNMEFNETQSNRRRNIEELQRTRDQRLINRLENNNNNTNNSTHTSNTNNTQSIINNATTTETESESEYLSNSEQHSSTQEIDTDNLLSKARIWIYKNEKEMKENIYLPKCNEKIRNKIRSSITNMFKDKILPLFETCESLYSQGGEAPWYYLEGVLAKTSILIRKTIRKTLKITINQMHKKKPVIDKSKHERTKYIEEKNIYKLSSHLEKYIELKDKSQEQEQNQNQLNAIATLEEEISNILKRFDNDFINSTFGGTDIEHIRNFINEENIHRQNKLNYIKNIIEHKDATTNGHVSNLYKQKIQSLYQEDPRRCYNWHINPKPSPECPLDIKTLEDFYSKEWNDTNIFLEPTQDSIWYINKCLNEEDQQQFLDSIINEESIKEVIRTRPNLSANGSDGISNAIWKFSPKLTSKIVKIIIQFMLKYNKIPYIWKESKTILLYKKGDPNEVRSWRPISISSTLYRIIFCHFSKCISALNNNNRIINRVQKGFKMDINGASEHVETVNELINNAVRQKRSIYILSLDFTNAFGTVPHDLICWALKSKGFPSCFTNLIHDSYKDTYTKFFLNGNISKEVRIKRGVKQGCPLSPTLFNLCLEPLLQAIQIRNKDDGIIIEDEINNEVLRFNIQAYADDIILMSSSEKGINNMLRTVEEFCSLSGMTLAPKKCRAFCYTYLDRNRHSISTEFKINNEIIPQVSLLSSIQYLGIPVACARAPKKAHARQIINGISLEIDKIFDSPLKITQKIDCIKRLILPKLDYVMINSVCPQKDLTLLDLQIRKGINNLCKSKGIPTDFFYTNWKDGGLDLHNLWERSHILNIRSLITMINSRDPTVKKFFEQMIKDETEYRDIIKDPNSPYMNIAFDDNGSIKQTNKQSNNTLFTRAINSLHDLRIHLSTDEDNTLSLGDVLLNGPNEDVNPISTLDKLNQLIWSRHSTLLKNRELKGHTFHTLTNSKVSNFFFTQCKYPINDSLAKFTILSRVNNLPTGEILHKNNQGLDDGFCHICSRNQNDSLMHRLNGCFTRRSWYTPRHDAVLKEIIKGIKELHNDNNIIFKYSIPITRNGISLPDDTKRLKPDAWFFKDNKLSIIEITCPYGTLKDHEGRRESSLTIQRNVKLNKYKKLVEDCKKKFRVDATLYVIVVSSLGAVPKETMEEIKRLLEHNTKLAKLVAKRCTTAALRESMKIYIKTLSHTNENSVAITNPSNHSSSDDEYQDIEDAPTNELFDSSSDSIHSNDEIDNLEAPLSSSSDEDYYPSNQNQN